MVQHASNETLYTHVPTSFVISTFLSIFFLSSSPPDFLISYRTIHHFGAILFVKIPQFHFYCVSMQCVLPSFSCEDFQVNIKFHIIHSVACRSGRYLARQKGLGWVQMMDTICHSNLYVFFGKIFFVMFAIFLYSCSPLWLFIDFINQNNLSGRYCRSEEYEILYDIRDKHVKRLFIKKKQNGSKIYEIRNAKINLFFFVWFVLHVFHEFRFVVHRQFLIKLMWRKVWHSQFSHRL